MYSQLEGGWDQSVGTAITVLRKSKIREAISRMSANEEIQVADEEIQVADEKITVGDMVQFLYSTPPAIYRLGIVREIELGPPVYNSLGLDTIFYNIEVLGQEIVETYKPTGKFRGLYKHRWSIKKYQAPHLVEQVLRASEPIDPAKVSMRNIPLGVNLDILHAAGMIGEEEKAHLYKRLVPPPIRSGDGKWVPGTVEPLLLPRKTAAAAGGGGKSRRTRRNKRLSRRSTRR